jgi:hypothetical protein
MTKFDGTVHGDECRFGCGRYPRDAVGPGHWVNPLLGVLGALVLSGYLMTGHPSTPLATAPASLSDEQLALEQVPPQLAFSTETGSLPHSSVAQDGSTFSSMPDLLKAAFAAALALAWAVFGAWLGARRARGPNPFERPAAHPSRTTQDLLRPPTCERMYDETRLVPHYIRRAEFPATKQDLLRLAEVHPDEGLALRRLECIPERCYSSLHDLITEIRVD